MRWVACWGVKSLFCVSGINVFIRKDYQTGLLRFARNDAGVGDLILGSSPKMTKETRCHPELVSGSHYSIYQIVIVCKIYEMLKTSSA